jgi:hypothetical protein
MTDCDNRVTVSIGCLEFHFARGIDQETIDCPRIYLVGAVQVLTLQLTRVVNLASHTLLVLIGNTALSSRIPPVHRIVCDIAYPLIPSLYPIGSVCMNRPSVGEYIRAL